jgi:glycosyltransferase involved in cell wall biosynthesis
VISVVIPAFNEGPAIRETIRQVGAALAGVVHEIIVVDDGSADTTGAQAAEVGARVIRHAHNIGYGGALKTGIRAAAHDTIVITDADGTYPNADIPRLLDEFGKGFNMVVGARSGSHYHESAVKTPLRYLLKWLVEFTTGRRIPDVNSGLRVFSRAEALPYLNHLCNTFSFTTSITLAYMMTSKFVGYVPIAYYERVGGTKVRLFRDSLRTLQYIVQAILYYNPLKMFILVSALLFVTASVLMIIAFQFDSAAAFYLGAGGMALVVTVFCLGLLAELLSQIMIKPR